LSYQRLSTDKFPIYTFWIYRTCHKDRCLRQQCVFIAFDLLYLNGKDLRALPLIERKAMLKKLLRRRRSRILYLDHVEGDGRLLFEKIVKMDLEALSASGRIHRTR